MTLLLNRLADPLRPLRYAKATWFLAWILISIHTALFLAGGYEVQYGWYEKFGLQSSVLLKGEIWQLFTYAFLHGGWAHVVMNAVCVLLIGAKLEWVIGWRNVAACASLGILSGGVAHVILGVTSQSLLVGFSGGCMALLLLLTTLSPQSKMFPLPISARSLGLGILFAELLLALMDPRKEIPGFSQMGSGLVNLGFGSWFEVGHACHLGGAVAGWLYGRWMLRPRITLASLKKERQRREESVRMSQAD